MTRLSAIGPLLLGRRPAAIARLVVSVVVDAINGKGFWRLAHVCQKVLETIPPFTNAYSARPVIAIIAGRWIVASPNDALPNYIGPGFASTHGVAMSHGSKRLSPLFGSVRTPASAGLRGPATKRVANNHRLLAAIANAIPSGAIRNVWRTARNTKPLKPHSSHVFCRAGHAAFVAFLAVSCAANDPPQPQVIQLPPVERVVNIFPAIPSDALACLGEPLVPDIVETDTQLAAWTESVSNAGADCRAKLGWLRDLVATWPR